MLFLGEYFNNLKEILFRLFFERFLINRYFVFFDLYFLINLVKLIGL